MYFYCYHAIGNRTGASTCTRRFNLFVVDTYIGEYMVVYSLIRNGRSSIRLFAAIHTRLSKYFDALYTAFKKCLTRKRPMHFLYSCFCLQTIMNRQPLVRMHPHVTHCHLSMNTIDLFQIRGYLYIYLICGTFAFKSP